MNNIVVRFVCEPYQCWKGVSLSNVKYLSKSTLGELVSSLEIVFSRIHFSMSQVRIVTLTLTLLFLRFIYFPIQTTSNYGDFAIIN